MDYDDNFSVFSSFPGITLVRIWFRWHQQILTFILWTLNRLLHNTQADILPEEVNGRYFINPPPGSPDTDNKDMVYEVLRPLYGNPSSQELSSKRWMHFS